jgi:hypothetical protein
MTDQKKNGGKPSLEVSVRFPLPEGVHFEVPRDYARFCNGHPVHVGSGDAPEDNVVVTWAADTIRFASGTAVVEYDLANVRGLLVNLAEPVASMIASTIRVVFEDPASSERVKMTKDTLISLLIVSANPARAESVRQIAEFLSHSQAPVTVFSSMVALMSQRN